MHSLHRKYGIVGNAASGKDFVADIFAERNYYTISCSDILREIIIDRGFTPNRALQTHIANELRQRKGGNFLVQEALRRAYEQGQQSQGIVISGIYAPSEAQYLGEAGAILLGVVGVEQDDDLEARYRRLRRRSSGPRDNLTYGEFTEAHRRENGGVAPTEANVSSILSAVDHIIVNDGISRGLVERQINQVLRNVA